jgi:hypothetical protein
LGRAATRAWNSGSAGQGVRSTFRLPDQLTT